METIIQKAAKGNRAAMTELYENNAATVYCLANALLRGSDQAVPATTWGIKSAFQAAEKGVIECEKEFLLLAMKQAAGYCKKEVIRKDPRAFKLPPKKEFTISRANEHAIDPNAADVENYIRCLPAIQRFTFVLSHLGDMEDLQIGKVIGMDTGAISLIKEAEAQNLAKICKEINVAGGCCSDPVPEVISAGFVKLQENAELPDAVCGYIENYIDSIATPIEAAAKNKGKKIGIIAGVVLVCIAIIVTIIAGTINSNVVTSGDDDYFETSGSDATDGAAGSDTTDATDGSSAAGDLDANAIYYADIEIEDYGTITVQLDQEAAPITVANFVNLAESGFYDGLTFHRIWEGFMMQGGDPNGDGTGGSDEEIVGEFSANGYDNPLSHTRGAISMARSDDYDSASSQFFIVHEDSTDSLDGLYAAFGYVTEGMDIVDAICEAAEPIDSNAMIATENQPVITSITIRTESTGSSDSTDTTDATGTTDATNTTESTDSGTVTE